MRERAVCVGFKIEGDQCCLIELSQGQWMLANESDLDFLLSRNWYAAKNRSGKYYAMEARRDQSVYAHRVLTNAGLGQEVDHRNGCTLDLRRKNLRVASGAENRRNVRRTVRNTSGFKGVSLEGRTQRFRAQIRDGKRNVHLGMFATAEAAHAAYCVAAKARYGEFANFG